MKAYVPDYEMRVPNSLGHALELLAHEPGVWKPFAGGTDLMVLFESGKLDHKRFLSIRNLRELCGIEVTPESITLGALTTYSDVQRHELLSGEFPMLAKAAQNTGGIATQNRGTVGGNIVNASPAADTPPALLAYDAEVELMSERGSRWLPYSEFHTGYKKMRIEPDELLARVRLRRDIAGWKQYYRKVGTRKAQAISKVCFAGVLDPTTREARIGLGSVAPIPLRCFKTEAAIRAGGDVSSALLQDIAPIADIRSTAEYRSRVVQNLLQEFLNGQQ